MTWANLVLNYAEKRKVQYPLPVEGGLEDLAGTLPIE